jgi:chromosome partitioning protein
MPTRIIAVLNQKGGVGKTTTTVNLGAALARRGQEVLLIDMDPQANLTVHVGVDPRSLSTDPDAKSSYSLLLGRHGLGESIRPTSTAGLSVVPSTLALANAEIQLASAVGRELILRDALEEWLGPRPSPKADFVLIDCPPSLGILTMNALCASTDVLLPIQAEFFALQGVAGILESLKAVQRLNRELKLSLVVPCLVDKRKTLAREILEEVRRYFGNLVTKTMIRANVKLAEAPSHGKTIFEYDAASNGAQDYQALAAEVLGEPQLPSDDEDVFAETPVASSEPDATPEPAAEPLGEPEPSAVSDSLADPVPPPETTVGDEAPPADDGPVSEPPQASDDAPPIADAIVTDEPISVTVAPEAAEIETSESPIADVEMVADVEIVAEAIAPVLSDDTAERSESPIASDAHDESTVDVTS